MKTADVVTALGALAHEYRLGIFRLLVERGPEGLPAGVIADRMGLVPSSLTFHVQALQRAGLITQRRASRQLIYSADYGAMSALLSFLTERCCAQSESACLPNCLPASVPAKSRKSRRAA
jgi:ArsR family transcriptional regulator